MDGNGTPPIPQLLQDLAPRGWLNVILTVVSLVIAFVAGTRAPESGRWLAAGIVATALVALWPAWLAWSERRQREFAQAYAADLQTKFQVATGRVLAPVAQRLAELQCEPDPARQSELRAEARTHILNAALALSECPNGRVCLYRLGRAPRPDLRELKLVRSLGRQDAAREGFDRDDARYRAVMETIKGKQAVLVQDVLELDNAHYTGRSYRTYAAAPIYAGETPLGFLAVDDPEPGAIDRNYTGTLMALASMLAMTLSDR